jgi:uncharacterized membrane protein YhfC
MDLTQKIPLINMVTIGVLALLSVAVPIMAFQISRKRFYARWQSLFPGLACYLIVDYGINNLLILLILNIPGAADLAGQNVVVYSICQCVLSAVASGIGLYLLLKHACRFQPSVGTILMFAAGYATARSVLLIASNAFQTLMVAMTVNRVGLDELVKQAGEDAESLLQAVEPLYQASPADYLAMAADVPLSFLFHAACCIVLYAVFCSKLPRQMIMAVIGLRFLYELPTYLYSAEFLVTSVYVSVLISAVIAVGTGYLAWIVAKRYLMDDMERLKQQKVIKKTFPDFNAHIHK